MENHCNTINNNMDTLEKILNDMDIPTNRRELTFGNLMWMVRNLRFRNADNPMINQALKLIKSELKNRW